MIPFLFSIAEYYQLNENNFDSTTGSHKRMCIKVYSTFCPHSQKFAPTWTEFVELNKNNTDVEFGEVECHSNEKLCKNLTNGLFPRVLWVESAIGLIYMHNGERTIPVLKEFMNQMPYYPFNFSTFELNHLKASKTNPVYSLTLPYKEKGNLDSYRKMFLEEEISIPNLYLAFTEYGSAELKMYGENIITYSEEMSPEAYRTFIQKNSPKRVFKFSKPAVEKLMLSGSEFVYLRFDSKHKLQAFLPIFERSLAKYKTYYEIYGPETEFGKEFGLTGKNIIVFIDERNGRYCQLKSDKPTYLEVSKWVDNIEQGKRLSWKKYNSSDFFTKLCFVVVIVLIVFILYRVVFKRMKFCNKKRILLSGSHLV
ncbi:hypothetical protein TVAG_030620 [Trichomonas vaginalis G3]|uniref:Thioredoxin domain-containing protein n=1 Tax=Trichomonas vaginalis (strain ATCC PRA-98 / G3) TaxID=412133 RepID=A2EYA0_TRIV3|nr:disulfide-isomerase C17h9.14C-related family [Trichomonas vaginalis G3]EAY02388.1 hypothetical protein TVAG_030620 [Trichomonas vaginalis G3]KAI5501190.1 disulfide-isomerase C17h9.14C-related family [Trichomonas vaginalis G3]|eukprot:XP_001330649.1 hypothetical protein [Trichomonas vaginalis G3]